MLFIKLGRYRHVKGNFYTLTAIAKHTETTEKMAIYEDKNGNIWARPLAMFLERFEFVRECGNMGDVQI